MTEIRQVRQEGAKFDMVISDNIQEVYADGVFQTMIGVPVSKLLFFSVSSAATEAQMSNGIESRKAVLEITIPTTALVEFAQNTLASIAGNVAAMDESFAKYKAAFHSSLNNVKVDSADAKKP